MKALEIAAGLSRPAEVERVSDKDIHNILQHLVRDEPFEAGAYCLAVKADLGMLPSEYVLLISYVINTARQLGRPRT